MATATPSGVTEQTPKAAPQRAVPFDSSRPPNIENFEPFSIINDNTFKDKVMRNTKNNPFVLLGCLGTAGALVYGLRAFHKGESRQSQLFMRGRIAAQGFTVVAIVAGLFAAALKPKA